MLQLMFYGSRSWNIRSRCQFFGIALAIRQAKGLADTVNPPTSRGLLQFEVQIGLILFRSLGYTARESLGLTVQLMDACQCQPRCFR